MPEKIELITNHVVEELQGEQELENMVVRHVSNNTWRVIPVKGIFMYVGMQAESQFLPASLDMDPQGFIPTDAEMRTRVPGIFAAGDIRVKNCRQVSSAVGDGATAATAALSYLEQSNV
jgi:thioredoxin reductase (NADPH)